MTDNPETVHQNLVQNGNILASQYEIVRRMLRYLPMRDLTACCQVCKLWNEIGLMVKREACRYNATTLFWEGECSDVSYYSVYPLFQSPHHQEMYSGLEALMSEMMIRPKLAVIAGTGDTELSVRDSKPGLQPQTGEDNMEKSWLVDKNSVTARLPRDCFSIGTTCRGIVGIKSGVARELENLFDESNLLCPAMSMLLIPEKPGCKILPFHLAENQLDGYIEEIRKEWVYPIDDTILQEKILEKAIPDLKSNDKVRALILLSNGLDLPFSMHIIQGASRRTNGNIAIGGAVGDLCWSSLKDTSMLALMRELFYFNYQSVPVAENSYMSTSGFVIAGENVEAASVLIPRRVRSEKKLVAELEKLRQSGINEENSFAFMFACCGRGENHYRGRRGLEANTFVKMFPKTPLVGVFGNGELGVSYLPNFKENVPETEKISAKLKAGEFLHSFTTIFVMVSFGNC